jgi:hypothetical protein
MEMGRFNAKVAKRTKKREGQQQLIAFALDCSFPSGCGFAALGSAGSIGGSSAA